MIKTIAVNPLIHISDESEVYSRSTAQLPSQPDNESRQNNSD